MKRTHRIRLGLVCCLVIANGVIVYSARGLPSTAILGHPPVVCRSAIVTAVSPSGKMRNVSVGVRHDVWPDLLEA